MNLDKLTLIERDLLQSIRAGYRPQGNEPELRRLKQLGLVEWGRNEYVVTTDGYRLLLEKVVV